MNVNVKMKMIRPSIIPETMKKIEGLNICENKGLLDSIDFITKMTNYIEQKNLMESFLRYKNFVDKTLYLRCSRLPGSDPNEGMVIGDLKLQLSLNLGNSVCEVACFKIDMTVD